MFAYWQGMFGVGHFFALSNPALVSALSKKIILQRQLANLGMQQLEINRGDGVILVTAKGHQGPVLKLALPLSDLIGMHVVQLR